MARYRGKAPVKATNFSFDGAHPAVAEHGTHYLHEQPDAPQGTASPGKAAHRDGGSHSPGRSDPSRASAEYVSRLEAELAQLKRSVATLGDPLRVASSEPEPAGGPYALHGAVPKGSQGPGDPHAPPSRPRSAVAPTPTARDKDAATHPGGPASMAPPAGRATATSATTLEDDLARAKATYSDERLAQFERALEEKFKASGGYDSDLEREMAAHEAMPADLELAQRKVKAERDAKAAALEQAEVDNDAASLEKQNEWMDEYRGDSPGLAPASRPARPNASPGRRPASALGSIGTSDPSASDANDANANAFRSDPIRSDAARRRFEAGEREGVAEEELKAAEDAVAGVRARTRSAPRHRVRGIGGVDGHGACATYLGDGPHGDGLPRPDVLVRKKTATVPKPPSFLARDANRPKTITQQRLEQELAIEAELEAAELRVRFKAAPIPRSTMTPKFRQMQEAEAARREANRASRRQALVETERPFSFYLRDKEAKRYEGETDEERAKRRANKFQRPFKAKEIPRAVREARLPALEEEAQRRREEARANAAAALASSKLPERMAAHGDGSETREKTLAEKRSKWSFKPGPRKEVPNFDALHDAFFRKLKEAKKNRPATVVREFKLHEKDAAQRERDLRTIEMDAKMDEKILPEVRWPFASLRAKVNSTPPPAFAPPSEDFLRKNENLATKLRRQAVAKERAKGQFMTKTEREAKAEAERARENRRRAAAWAKAQIGGGRAGPGAEPPLDQHRAARRKQQEALAKETVEKVLLENNVYTYVEEGTA